MVEETLEHILTSYYKDEMIARITSNPNRFDELVQLTLSNHKRFSPRATWLLSSIIEENDKRITQYVPQLMNAIGEASDGKQRDLINTLGKAKIDEQHEGVLFDICISLWENTTKIPSVRYVAFKLILQLAAKYPELFHEITLLTQNQYMESLSPGIRRSLIKMVTKFKKEHLKE